MYVIGKADTFYTLWQVHTYEAKRQVSTQYTDVYRVTEKIFIQNLSSKSLDDAMLRSEKIGNKALEFNPELRGTKSFTSSEFTGKRIDMFPVDVFPFGKLVGEKIMECEDTWQLIRTYKGDNNPRRRVIARARLIDLGELVRLNGEWVTLDRVEELRVEKLEKGHVFSDGERVQIDVRLINSFHFETAYGWSTIQIFETSCGKVVKYVGASPIDGVDKQTFVQVKATVKHTEYRDMPETRIMRAKVIV